MAVRDAKALWPVLVALVIAVGAVGAAVFWPAPPTSLRVSNYHDNSASAAVANIRIRTPYVFAAFPLCVAHGSVTIDRVTPHPPSSGLDVVDWAVATTTGDNEELGYPRRAGQMSGFHGHTLSAPCSQPRFLAVSVERTADMGVTNGFEVHSTSGSVVIPLAVKLCPAGCGSGITYSGTP